MRYRGNSRLTVATSSYTVSKQDTPPNQPTATMGSLCLVESRYPTLFLSGHQKYSDCQCCRICMYGVLELCTIHSICLDSLRIHWHFVVTLISRWYPCDALASLAVVVVPCDAGIDTGHHVWAITLFIVVTWPIRAAGNSELLGI